MRVALLTSCLAASGTLPAANAPASAAVEQTTALAVAIDEKLEGTETWAMNSGFPRATAVAEMAKAVLVTVDAAKVPGRVETAAIDHVLAGKVSNPAREALEIVRRECADD